NLTESQLKGYHYHKLTYIGDIMEKLWELPYTSLEYVKLGWYFDTIIIPSEPLQQVAVYLDMTSHGFYGTLTTGIKETYSPPPPPEWIVSKESFIWLQRFQTRNYLILLPATALEPETPYRLNLTLANSYMPYWWGTLYVWLLPESVT
ncbi:unnamed protein product, partial [marine sediment metagenome]